MPRLVGLFVKDNPATYRAYHIRQMVGEVTIGETCNKREGESVPSGYFWRTIPNNEVQKPSLIYNIEYII